MSELSDAIKDAHAAELVRATRTPAPDTPEVRWAKGKTLEIDALPVPEGQSAMRAALEFLDKAMGEDAGLVDALDLEKMSFSLLYDAAGERQLAWIKCPVDRSKIRTPQIRQEAEKFVTDVCRRRARKARIAPAGETVDKQWFVSDLQLGKHAEAFGGLAATMGRLDWLINEELPATTPKNVRKIGINLLGDLTEGCQGSYTNQQYLIVLNTAEQFRAALGVVDRMVERALDLAEIVEITAVGSNHDQAARGPGRENVTDHWDDRSFMLLDALQLAYSKNPDRYGNRVRIEYPDNPLVAAVQVRDTVLAMTHGHKAQGRGPNAVSKLADWWEGQIGSRHGAAAAANVLIAAHHHHHYLLRDGGRLLVGLPAMDGGSGYLKDGKGTWSMPGFVTMGIDDYGVAGTQLHTWPEDRKRARDQLGLIVP